MEKKELEVGRRIKDSHPEQTKIMSWQHDKTALPRDPLSAEARQCTETLLIKKQGNHFSIATVENCQALPNTGLTSSWIAFSGVVVDVGSGFRNYDRYLL